MILRFARSPRRHGARNVPVFGSIGRGDDRPGSDLDLLVDLVAGRTLLDLVDLKQDLEDLLGRRADVVTERTLPAMHVGLIA